MTNLIQQLKRVGQKFLYKYDRKTQQPLLDNNEILQLLQRIKSNNKTRIHKHDIAFRQIGDVRSIFRGHGMDYEESRHYLPGDDPRYMNWQLTARTGQQYMKVFREERQPGVFILVDRRHSMRFGTKRRLKITQAARVAVISAFSAEENNLSVGGVILDNEQEWYKEKQNKQGVFEFIHQAARPAPPALDQQQVQEPNLQDVLRMLTEVLTTGSTIYLISDFHDLNKSSQAVLLKLSSSHKVHAIHITDPAEIKLPKAGELSLKSINGDKQYHINTRSLLQRKKYESFASEYFHLKKQLFENIAISYHEISTTVDDIEQVITF